MEEHNNYAVDFINATREDQAPLPGLQDLWRRVQPRVLLPRQRARAPRDPFRLPVPRDARQAWTWASSTARRWRRMSTRRSTRSSSSMSRTSSSTAAPTRAPSACSSSPRRWTPSRSARRAPRRGGAGAAKADAKAWRDQAVGKRLEHALVKGIDEFCIAEDRGVPHQRRLRDQPRGDRGPPHGRA